jgi:tetratricopeptide (TPR) repeat protein
MTGRQAMRAMMISRRVLLVFVTCLATTGLASSASHAEPSSPAVEERRELPFSADAESEYNRGVRARLAKEWAAAVEAFRAAVTLRPNFPEAWNELGYAFRNQGRYSDSLAAYDEALRLRPNFPEALEYLGEAYVKMGRLDDARGVLQRLRPLDSARADELDEVIEKAR